MFSPQDLPSIDRQEFHGLREYLSHGYASDKSPALTLIEAAN